MSKKANSIKYFESACENLATDFQRKYFGMRDVTSYWIAEEVAGCFVIQEDYFFNVETMVDYLKYGYGKEKMFKRYHEELETLDKKGTLDGFPNIKNWIKLKTK